MRHKNKDTTVPTCPACGSSHYPAELGDGSHEWCDGRKAIYATSISPEVLAEAPGLINTLSCDLHKAEREDREREEKGIFRFDGSDVVIPDSI